MPFTEHYTDTELVMSWSGDVDAETAHQPYESAVAVFDRHPVRSVVVDLSGVTFADSVALGSLVRIRDLAASNGARFALRLVPPRVRSLLSMTGLDQNLTIIEGT